MTWSISTSQTELEERLRTLSLCVSAVILSGFALYWLRPALLPLVLAIALKHLLEPVIYVLSVRPLSCNGGTYLAEPLAYRKQLHSAARWRSQRLHSFVQYACRLQLPRTAAVFVSLLLAFAVLGLIGLIVANSARVFAGHADMYADQLKIILGEILGWMESFSCGWLPSGCHGNHTVNGTEVGANATDVGSEVEQLLSSLPISEIAIHLAEDFFELCSNLFVVLLFTVYLLLSKQAETPSAADKQILEYIKGKVALSCLVGGATAIVLFAVGLDLWLVFGAFAFWLNFIPNVGAVVAVLLPMPLVILDPEMHVAAMILAFVLPFCVHMVVGNVFEPLLFGHSLELQPVVILLSLMIWGMLWGIIGMVLAVPMTAVLKIQLEAIDHPVAVVLVRLLVGDEPKPDVPAADERVLLPSADMAPLEARGTSSTVRPLVTPAAPGEDWGEAIN